MAKNKRQGGMVTIPVNYNPAVLTPLDSRQLVDNITQLLNAESWGTNIYKGMLVVVADIGVLYDNLTTEQKAAKYTVNAGTPDEGQMFKYVADANSGYAIDQENDEYVSAGKGAVYMLKNPSQKASLENGWQLVGESDGTLNSLDDVNTLLTAISGKYVINSAVDTTDWTASSTYISLGANKFGKVNKSGKSVDTDNNMKFRIPIADQSNAGVMSATDKTNLDTLYNQKPEPISSAALDLLLIETEAEEEVITPTVHTTSTATPTEATGGYYTFAVKSKTGGNAPSYSNPFTASSEPAIGDIIRTSANGNSAYEFVVVEVYEMSPAENVTATIAKTVRRSSTASGS